MSLSKKTTLSDPFFWVQLLGAFAFCGTQLVHSLTDVQGVSLVQFALATAFSVFLLLLAIGAHRARPSKETATAIANYIVWAVMLTAVVVVVATNDDYRWTLQDTVTLVVTTVLATATLGIGKLHGRPIRDPVILASLAIASKAVPQALLVWSILEYGGSGIPLWAILVGHTTILARMLQLTLKIRREGPERNLLWMRRSEAAAWLTWLAVTIAWIPLH